MTVLSPRKVDKSLTKKGFKKEPGDHNYYVFYYNGKKTSVFTKTSHNDQDIGDDLISMMSKQVHLNKKQFLNLVNCPLSKEKYTRLVIENGFVKE